MAVSHAPKRWLSNRTVPAGLARWRRRVAGWRRPAVIPPNVEKRRIIRGYGQAYGLRTLVETGTCLGGTVEAAREHFGRVVSIELSEELATRAQARFREYPNVRILQGDSGVVLPDLLAELTEPALFWLDGHYSEQFYHGGETILTARGESNTPVLTELRHVLAHGVAGHVVLIDDARLFDGTDDYPTIRDLRTLIRVNGIPRRLKVDSDIIRITPASARAKGN